MAAYYDMVASLDSMRVLEDAIGADSKLTDLYRRRVDLGFGSPFDVQQAAVQVSTDREALLVAKNNFLERQYALKRLVLAKFESADPRLFFPENTTNLPPPPLDRAGFLATAFENRYDYRGQVLNAESQNIRLRFAKNQLLPELDLVATYGLNGLGYTAGSGFSDTFSADHPQFSVGVQFQYPLGNRQAQRAVRGGHRAKGAGASCASSRWNSPSAWMWIPPSRGSRRTGSGWKLPARRGNLATKPCASLSAAWRKDRFPPTTSPSNSAASTMRGPVSWAPRPS